MRIGIVGAGRIGSTLATQLTHAGYVVAIANSRGPASLHDVAAATGAEPVELRDIAIGAEALMLAAPFPAVSTLPPELFTKERENLVVVDAGNYVPWLRDDPIQAIEDGQPESVWVSEQIGHPVIKAFNTVNAASLENHLDARIAPNRIALPVAGEQVGKRLVERLAEDLGFDFIDAGQIIDSWRQQPGTPIHTTDLTTAQASDALAQADPAQTSAWREAVRHRSQQNE